MIIDAVETGYNPSAMPSPPALQYRNAGGDGVVFTLQKHTPHPFTLCRLL